MGVPVAAQKLVEAFAQNAPDGNVPGGATVPFPVASRVIAGFPGQASLDTGFTPANMTPLASGGIPMSGPDTNGALKLISAPVAMLTAGQLYFPFDGAYAALISGYNKGAVVADATDPTVLWVSAIAANTDDPAVTPASWICSKALYSASTPAAGTHSDNVLPGPSDFFLSVDTTAGAITLDSFVAQRDGQRLYINCAGANNLTVGGRTGGTAAHNVLASSALQIAQFDTLVIQWFEAIASGVGRWVFV